MIRRISFLILLLASLASGASAQSDKQLPTVLVGATAGFSANKVLFSPSVEQNQLIAPSGGALLRVDVERTGTLFLGFQTEVSFVRLGWEENFAALPAHAYRRTFDCVTLPLLTHLKIKHNKLYAFLNLGPKFGIIIRDKAVREGTVFSELQLRRYEQSLHGKLEWGLAGGPGCGFDAGRMGAFELEGRIYYGFNDLLNNRQQDPHGKSSNLTLSIKINYLFRL